MVDVQQLKATENARNSEIPLGDWSGKPAVAATTVAVENTSGYNMFVEVTGGTVTSIKVDGVTVGARTSGLFYVRAGSTIAWAGSSAPTWQWFYA
jgi:hypothetical protein